MEGGSERCNIASFEDGESGRQPSLSICLSSGSLARMQVSQGPEVGPVHGCISGTQSNA